MSDNNFLWKSDKKLFSVKGTNSSKITLVEESNKISKEEEIANTMNNYFVNAKRFLNLKKQISPISRDTNKFGSAVSIKMAHKKYSE